VIRRARSSYAFQSGCQIPSLQQSGGKWKYLFRAIGKHGQLIDFMLSDRRNTRSAYSFLRKAMKKMNANPPGSITTDKLASYPSGAILDQGLAGDQQLLHRVQSWTEHRPGGRLEQRPKARQQGCVEPVGFGELPERLSEAAGVAGIDLRQGQTRGRERAFQGTVVGSGGLKDHALNGVPGQPGDESAMAFGVVGEAAGRSIGAEADIETIFGNVDAGSLW
jgi:hypothetical protein